MISVQNVTKAFGPKKLFEDVNVAFSPGQPLRPHRPERRRQDHVHEDPRRRRGGRTPGTVLRPKKLGHPAPGPLPLRGQPRPRRRAHGQRGALGGAAGEGDAPREGRDHRGGRHTGSASWRAIIAEEDGYSAEADAAELLAGPRHRASPGTSSRCARSPAATSCACCSRRRSSASPQGLLLDEPTNNLDIDSIRWLETFLHEYEGVLITISHDRHFLNAICTHIADIDYETIITYPGGYDDMVRQKGQVRSRVESENAEKKKKIAQLQDFVARFHAGTRASQVQSRIRADREAQARGPEALEHRARRSSSSSRRRPRGKQTLTDRGHLRSATAANEVIQPFSALVTQGEKICVIGKNGVGKTTLVKMIAGRAAAGRGHVAVGPPGAGRLPAAGPRTASSARAPPRSAGCASSRTSSRTRRSRACSAGCSSRARSG